MVIGIKSLLVLLCEELAVQPHAHNSGDLRAGDIHSKKNKLDDPRAEGQCAMALRQEMPGVQRIAGRPVGSEQ